MPDKPKNAAAQELARLRWSRIPKEERAKHVPKNGGGRRRRKDLGGAERKYPDCPIYRGKYGRKYGTHRFDKTGKCGCGFVRPANQADIDDMMRMLSRIDDGRGKM